MEARVQTSASEVISVKRFVRNQVSAWLLALLLPSLLKNEWSSYGRTVDSNQFCEDLETVVPADSLKHLDFSDLRRG